MKFLQFQQMQKGTDMKDIRQWLPLPDVWAYPAKELIGDSMRLEAQRRFAQYSLLPSRPDLWETKKKDILKRMAENVRLKVNHALALDMEITQMIRRDGYRIEKLSFQADENRYVTGCLYIPDGEGPFPAVLNVHGHWAQGHLAERVQARGHILAQNGFVVLSVDAFGSGERSLVHGTYEYHGGLRGLQLNNLGETLIGIQIADNMRALDLLSSLPYVDSERLGVTGASGGGNQTMYLTVFDERVKAAVSVCSVSSFQAMIMRSNCICETIPAGFTVCEESGLVACIAPRPYAMLCGLYDNGTFDPDHVMHTYQTARKVYEEMGAGENLRYKVFPTNHGYYKDALSYMLGFFKYYLKNEGIGLPAALPPIEYMTEEEAMVYPVGTRPGKVKSMREYCSILGEKAKEKAAALTVEEKREGLKKVLRSSLVSVAECSRGEFENGWEKLVLGKTDGLVMPALMRPSENGKWRILSAAYGKKQLEAGTYLKEALQSRDGLLLIDIYASGETGNEYGPETARDYHNIARACLWMDRPLLGRWVNDYVTAAGWLKENYEVSELTVYGYRDAAVAALLAAALYRMFDRVVLEKALRSLNWSDCFVSDNAFTMGLGVQDILLYGDMDDYEQMLEGAEAVRISSIRADESFQR